MQRVFLVLIAIAALGLAGWFGVYALGGKSPLASIEIPIKATENLPDSPPNGVAGSTIARSTNNSPTCHGDPKWQDWQWPWSKMANCVSSAPMASPTHRPARPSRHIRLFRWASVSKTATGALAAALATDGAIDLNRPVGDSGTTLVLPGGAEARVTLEDVLAQRTGLTKNAYDEKLEEGQDPALLRASLVAAPLQCDPGTCHTYQNVAFDAASEILSRAANEPFGKAVEDRFFRPLGMVSAGYGMQRLTGAKDWARPHRNRHVLPVKEAYWRVPAAAGVESDIVDFATWMQAMMGSRPDVLPSAMLELGHRPRVGTARLYGGPLRQAISDASYGLGWRSFTYQGHRLEGHSGAVSGYRATMIFEPSTRTGVVALWNSDWGFPFRIPFAVIDSYHKREDALWLDLSKLPAQPGAAAAESDPAANSRDQHSPRRNHRRAAAHLPPVPLLCIRRASNTEEDERCACC
jgi:beta-lactamase class C